MGKDGSVVCGAGPTLTTLQGVQRGFIRSEPATRHYLPTRLLQRETPSSFCPINEMTNASIPCYILYLDRVPINQDFWEVRKIPIPIEVKGSSLYRIINEPWKEVIFHGSLMIIKQQECIYVQFLWERFPVVVVFLANVGSPTYVIF